jgi:2-oxoglutarate dehydrogenase E2 component (dihydrolipoamide succinyltransferase)
MTDIIEVHFPEEQQDGTEATITQWLVAEGDAVQAHDAIVEIETDKVVVEVAAPESGRIMDIKIRQDEEVNPGDVLCTLMPGENLEAGKSSTREKALTGDTQDVSKERNRLSPAVRQRVLEHNIDISRVQGTGHDGRITLQDVDNLVTAGNETGKAAQAPGDITPPSPQKAGDVTSDIIPHDKMRKRIADSMVTSLLHTAPHVTAVFEADLSAVMRHRKANKDAFTKRGAALTLTAYFVAASIAAIRKVPRVNSRWSDENLEIFKQINMGIGTALGDEGLIVPVVHNAQDMDLQAIAASLADLTTRAREHQLKPEDVRGGTFTISNHGVSGSLFATPIIIHQPQSAILGVGKIEKRIKVIEVDGEDVISIRPMCYVSLTIDHRVLDAFQTNAFLVELVATLESWPETQLA